MAINAKPINKDKIEKIIYKIGMNPRQISLELGHVGGYISTQISRGYFGNSLIQQLDRFYGIKFEDYELVGYHCESYEDKSKHFYKVVKDEEVVMEVEVNDIPEEKPELIETKIIIDTENIEKKLDDIGRVLLAQNELIQKLLDKWS